MMKFWLQLMRGIVRYGTLGVGSPRIKINKFAIEPAKRVIAVQNPER